MVWTTTFEHIASFAKIIQHLMGQGHAPAVFRIHTHQVQLAKPAQQLVELVSLIAIIVPLAMMGTISSMAVAMFVGPINIPLQAMSVWLALVGLSLHRQLLLARPASNPARWSAAVCPLARPVQMDME
jgi:hypothetical protein